jgi:hypothetical protein
MMGHAVDRLGVRREIGTAGPKKRESGSLEKRQGFGTHEGRHGELATWRLELVARSNGIGKRKDSWDCPVCYSLCHCAGLQCAHPHPGLPHKSVLVALESLQWHYTACELRKAVATGVLGSIYELSLGEAHNDEREKQKAFF